MGESLIKDERFQALKPGARYLYLCLASAAKGKKTIVFSGKTVEEYGIPRTTYDSYIKELKAAGFINVVDDGEHLQFWKHTYEFTYKDWKKRKLPPLPEKKRRTSKRNPPPEIGENLP